MLVKLYTRTKSQHCKVSGLFCGFYSGNFSLVGDSALLLTSAHCGGVSKQNETSGLGMLTLAVLHITFMSHDVARQTECVYVY